MARIELDGMARDRRGALAVADLLAGFASGVPAVLRPSISGGPMAPFLLAGIHRPASGEIPVTDNRIEATTILDRLTRTNAGRLARPEVCPERPETGADQPLSGDALRRDALRVLDTPLGERDLMESGTMPRHRPAERVGFAPASAPIFHRAIRRRPDGASIHA